MGCVDEIVSFVVKYTFEAIRRQVGYIIFYENNLEDLDKIVVDLDGVRDKVQNMVDEEKSNCCRIQVGVEPWLIEANQKINEAHNPRESPSCLNLIERHKLGRKAKEMVEQIDGIIKKGKGFDKVGSPLPLVNIDSSSIPGYQSIASRLSIAKVIKDALADTNNSKVGIHGMGGVGKSMLVTEVERLLKEHNLFNQVITVTIGQSMDVKAIQRKIIDMSRWNFEVLDEKATAALIRNKLMEMKNKILIVLDDLWKELKLEDVGIPGGCKILITSREKDVLRNDVGVETNFIFEVKSLNETEAWEFFKNRIGEIDNTSLEEIAKNVAKECGGLPIALDTVGKTLKGKILPIWRDALKQLQNPTTVKVKGVTTKVYGSLRLSYDFIQNDEARLIFLLCSVFPDDYEIPLETLSMYAMGMRLLNGVYTWEEAKDRMETLVDVLKSSSLLLESNRITHVKMHDVVRDVAIYISSEERCQMSTLCCGNEESDWRDKCGSYKAIFANCDGFHNLPQDLKFPKLESLILISGFRKKELLQIPETFFVGMEELKVLDLSRICFPKLMTSLRNLRTLCMQDCRFVDIDIIGEIKELEVLRIGHCGDVLPETMSRLTKLKVLRFSSYWEVKVIPFNIISKMMYLEELSLVGFKGWGKEVVYKGKSIQNAELAEFKYLQHLTNLSLTIPCVNCLLDLSFSDNLKLERFDINIERDRSYNKQEKSLRYLRIHSESEIVLNDDVDKILLKRCDKLSLKASVGITNLLFKSNGNYGYPDLRHLSLESDSDMRHLIGDQPRNCGVNYFSSLDTLNLRRMESLENIVHMDIRPNHFNKLRVINVEKCKQLKNLFSFPVFEGLSNLHKIKVFECDLMDELILMENEEGNVKTKCSIVSLEFTSVPQLTSFCSKNLTNQHRDNLIPFFDDQVAFPELESLKFIQASNLKMLWKNNGMISNSFCKLGRIDIYDCDNLRYMFPCSAMTTLVSLKYLFIQSCESLEAIFEMEEPFVVKENDVALPKLSSVSVERCPKLKSLFPASIKTLEIAQSNSSLFHEIAFPELESLVFEGASNLKMSWNGMISNSFCKLQRISIISCGNLRYMFPCSAMTTFVSLENLVIDRCESLEAIFEMEETYTVKENDVALPNLSYVSVGGCPKLVFPPSIIRLQQLQILEITGACKLFSEDKTLEIAQSNSSSLHEDQIVFPNLRSVTMSYEAMKINRIRMFSRADSFPKLKSLTFYGSDDDDDTDIWKMFFDHLELPNSIKLNSFPYLKTLSIWECNGLKNMLTSSVVKRLEYVEKMPISKYIMFVGDEEKIIVNKLVELNWKSKLMFPCLELLEIDGCDDMKIFSNGHISKPKLRYWNLRNFKKKKKKKKKKRIVIMKRKTILILKVAVEVGGVVP